MRGNNRLDKRWDEPMMKMDDLSRKKIVTLLVGEIAIANGWAQPDEMNEHAVKISKIGWARILKYANALADGEK